MFNIWILYIYSLQNILWWHLNSRPAPVKKALVTKWCLEESDLIPEDETDSSEDVGASPEESERSGAITEDSDIIVITSEDLADVDQDIIAAQEDNIFKRNVVIRPRKPKYQTNFIWHTSWRPFVVVQFTFTPSSFRISAYYCEHRVHSRKSPVSENICTCGGGEWVHTTASSGSGTVCIAMLWLLTMFLTFSDWHPRPAIEFTADHYLHTPHISYTFLTNDHHKVFKMEIWCFLNPTIL